MKVRLIMIAATLTLVSFIICPFSYTTDLSLNNTSTQVYFSPYGGCTENIVEQQYGAVDVSPCLTGKDEVFCIN